MADRNTTDVLQGDLNANESVAWILQRFHGVVKKFVIERLSEECRRRADVEQIVETSLRRALQAAQSDPKWRDSSDTFVGLLKTIAKRCVASEARHQTTQGRNAGREVALAEDEPLNRQDVKSGDPAKRAEFKEAVKIILSNLLQEKDEERRLINLLGIGLELNAGEIQAILQEHPDKFSVRSLPTIRTQIETARKRITELDIDQYQPDDIVIDFDEAA